MDAIEQLESDLEVMILTYIEVAGLYEELGDRRDKQELDRLEREMRRTIKLTGESWEDLMSRINYQRGW